MRKKKSINIVSVILSFAITVSILLMFVFGVAKYTGLSIRGVIHTCEKTEYYRELYNEMLDEALYVGRPYGIEKQHIENIIDYSKFIGDTNKKILSDIVGEEYNPDLSYIDIKIMENVEKIEENLTPEQR